MKQNAESGRIRRHQADRTARRPRRRPACRHGRCGDRGDHTRTSTSADHDSAKNKPYVEAFKKAKTFRLELHVGSEAMTDASDSTSPFKKTGGKSDAEADRGLRGWHGKASAGDPIDPETRDTWQKILCPQGREKGGELYRRVSRPWRRQDQAKARSRMPARARGDGCHRVTFAYPAPARARNAPDADHLFDGIAYACCFRLRPAGLPSRSADDTRQYGRMVRSPWPAAMPGGFMVNRGLGPSLPRLTAASCSAPLLGFFFLFFFFFFSCGSGSFYDALVSQAHTGQVAVPIGLVLQSWRGGWWTCEGPRARC